MTWNQGCQFLIQDKMILNVSDIDQSHERNIQDVNPSLGHKHRSIQRASYFHGGENG